MKKTDSDALGYAMAMMMASLPVVAVIMAFEGLVFQTLWGWFCVPALGLPSLSLLAAIGILITIRLPLWRQGRNAEKDPWKTIFSAIAHPALTLFAGWILHSLM